MGLQFDIFVERYVNFLLSSLPGKPKLASGGKEISCRCFYCPDSGHKDHGHFYISIPSNKEEPSMYFCQKCGERGYVTHKTLLDWNVWDQDIAQLLINHNKGIKYIKNTSQPNRIYRLTNINKSDGVNSEYKLKYINDRLGTHYTLDDLNKLKICLNLKDLLNQNNISRTTRSMDIIDQLDANFLGFISIDNGFLNMRRLCDKGLLIKSIDKRYINYNINNEFDTSHRFYTIPIELDPSNVPIHIHIAEGPFDILSIYENVRHREPGIYTAIGGSNYIGVVLYILGLIKVPCVVVHIYPDNDDVGNDKKMRYIHRILKKLHVPLYIHRNMYPGEKDFGVAPDHINEHIIDMQNRI